MKMALVCPLLLFLLSALPRLHSLASHSYYSDQEALLAFKHSLSSDPYNSLFDWSPNHSFCNWTGVICSSRHQRVLSLNLTGMSLLGPISPFLGNLSFLRVLSLKNNSFQGPIPSQLGRLFRLRILRLSRNKLSGSIPSALAGCRALESLTLSYNFLSGSIPPQLGLLSQLETIVLQENQLTGTIPSWLGNLSSLTLLAISSNKLHGGIPVELCMCSKLNWLDLIINNLTGIIPSFLGNLTSLSTLRLGYNKFHGLIPVELGMLIQLEELFLGYNNLTGVIPIALSNCTVLEEISLPHIQLSGHIPHQFSKLSKLRTLELFGNQLTGEIPSSLSNCTQLQNIEFNENQLNGKVPLEFGNLHQLQTLFLGFNSLVSGSNTLSILIALTNCSSLKTIYMPSNYLTGVLPSIVGQLSRQFSLLDLSSNKIEGKIPSEIGNLTMLSNLNLADNHFNGTIPYPLFQLAHLERLYLDKNNLWGSIPENLEAKSLGLLSLSENMISGKIPDSLGNLPQLRHLILHHNQLSRKIPSNLARCHTLELVDLSHNKLSGNISQELAGFTNLQFYFNISGNLLQGSLLGMSKMTMVQAIDVSLNNFSGEIPASLLSCTNLQYLNLSWNSLDGLIPTSLTKIKNLQDVDLSYNNLSGEIPMAFEEMKSLQHINLSSNRLVGRVPKEGVFARMNESAVMGNIGLCGEWINLQACSNSKHKRFMVSRKVIVPTVVGIAIFISSIALLLIFSRKRHANQIYLNIWPKRISYEELEGATNGFSQENLLGVGNFGSVYKGILNGMNIAVKVLNLQDEASLQTFSRECNVLKRVRHRNVIKIISTCSKPGFKALVLPLMSNGNLERWLYPEGGEECRLNLFDRLRIAKEVAQGLTYLHHHCFVQVIHCDLKPSNVLLGDDMTPYIADFGIAKLLFGNSMDSETSTNAAKGSIGYIAPEYGMGGRTSSNGDVYSYGVVLLELFTRRRPTNDMFVEGTNLPKWVGMAFPNKIIEVVDRNLLKDVNESNLPMAIQCLTQMIEVGLHCTRELPQQRPNMMEIIDRLEKITRTFLGARCFQLPIDISPFLESTSGPRKTGSRRDENWSTSTSTS